MFFNVIQRRKVIQKYNILGNNLELVVTMSKRKSQLVRVIREHMIDIVFFDEGTLHQLQADTVGISSSI